MKTVRVIFYILLLIILIGGLAIGVLIFSVNPNKLKPVIVSEVNKKTGYRLVIDGNLSWSFYPRFGIKIIHMTVTDPHQSAPFADLRNVNIATDFSQLWQSNKKLQGTIYIQEARLTNLMLQKIQIELHWLAPHLTLAPIVASFYDGKVEGRIEGSNFSTLPVWRFEGEFTHVDMQSLLLDMNGPDSKIKLSGRGYIKMQAASKGKVRNEFLQNLVSQGEFNLTNGAVEGIDLNYLVQSADALLDKKSLSVAPTNLKQTAFDSLTGDILIQNGVAETNHLLLISAAFTAKGNGSINLLNQGINYQLDINPVNTLKLTGTLPVIITGNLKTPDVRINTAALQQKITQDQLEKVEKKVEEKVKELPAKADKILQKLLGQ